MNKISNKDNKKSKKLSLSIALRKNLARRKVNKNNNFKDKKDQ